MKLVDKEERAQRVRYGLTGLGVVFLLVLLGSAVSQSAEDSAPPVRNELAPPEEPNEPLAEIGAAPGTASATNETSEEEPATSKAP